ncbi:pentapeptide repeat-containing protein [Nocardia sp. NPDC004278]
MVRPLTPPPRIRWRHRWSDDHRSRRNRGSDRHQLNRSASRIRTSRTGWTPTERSAYASHANLVGANLTSADLAGADLLGVAYDAHTQWPDGYTPPPSAR